MNNYHRQRIAAEEASKESAPTVPTETVNAAPMPPPPSITVSPTIEVATVDSVKPTAENWKPNGRVKFVQDGQPRAMDVFITDNDRSEVYVSLEDWIAGKSCNWLQFSSEGGWTFHGFPEGALDKSVNFEGEFI